MNKQEMLAAFAKMHTDWLEILQQLTEEEMEQSGALDNWAFRDIVAHLTGWRKRTLAYIEAAANGTAPEPPEWPRALGTEAESADNVPGINNWIYEANHNRPLPEVLAESEEVFRRLDAALSALPADRLNDAGHFAWLEKDWTPVAEMTGTLEHYYIDHEPDLKAWLDQIKST